MWKYTLFIAALTLAGCEGVDQGLHYSLGKGLADDLVRTGDEPVDKEKVNMMVMNYAVCREAWQKSEVLDECPTEVPDIPDHWGDGKIRDLEYWQRGVDASLGGSYGPE